MRNNSLSIKLFVSLSLLLVAMVIIFSIISNYAVVNSSEIEISKNCIGRLKVAENTLLQLKDSINKDTIRLSVNSAINDLGNIRSKSDWLFDSQNLFKLSKVIDVILQTVNTNSSYHSVYLYLEEMGYTFTSNYGFVSNKNLMDTGWMKYYRNYKLKGAALSWTETRLPSGEENDNKVAAPDHVITYIYPLTPYTTNLRGALVVNVREQVLSKLINSNNFNREGYIFIINREGDVISHVNDEYLCKNISDMEYIGKIVNSPTDDGYLVTDIDRSKSLVSYYKSNSDDWIYIGIFSLDSLISRVDNIRIFTIYLSLLILAIGVMAAFLISRRLYSPVKKLIQDIKSTKGIDFLENENEMTILSKAFETLKKHEESLFNALEKNRRNISENYLNHLLRGNCSCEVDKDFLQVDFKYPYYNCAVMSIDKYCQFIKEFSSERQYYLKMLILNVAEEVINSTYTCRGANADKGEIALIINVDHLDSSKHQELLKACFAKIQKEITKVFDYTVSISIGSCHQGEAEIKTSYLEASEALKSKLKYGCGNIFVWQKEISEQKYFYPFNMEKHILNYMGIKDSSGLEETIKRLMEEIRTKNGLSSDNVIQIFNQLVGNTIIKYLVDARIDMNQVFGSGFNIYHELSTKETLDDIQKWLIEVYNRVIGFCGKSDNNSKDKFDMIMDFIHKNYKNDIGIRDIADHVKLSYSHVRKIFKDETGENIVDYINSIRIKEARNLLEYTDICIKDLSISLGYNNDQSFTRAFKKFEGITPGEYRLKKS